MTYYIIHSDTGQLICIVHGQPTIETSHKITTNPPDRHQDLDEFQDQSTLDSMPPPIFTPQIAESADAL